MMSMPEEQDRTDSFQDQKNFLESSMKLFRYYKGLGEKAINQLSDEQVLRKPNTASNSIAVKNDVRVGEQEKVALGDRGP